jgi:ribonuclease-3
MNLVFGHEPLGGPLITFKHPLLSDIHFKDPTLLVQSLTHKSFCNEAPGVDCQHNERLEFLGDAVLDLVLSDRLMQQFPNLNEGDLSKIRAGLVNENTLSQVATELELQDALRLGRGELMSGGNLKPRLLASVFEALVGAIYLDCGFARVHSFVTAVFLARTEATDPLRLFETDYKTRLQEILQERYRKAPIYIVIHDEGPDHSKTFHVEVKLDQKTLAVGQGRSKKQAEQQAACNALKDFL